MIFLPYSIYNGFLSTRQFFYQFFQLFIELRIVAAYTMSHTCNDLVIVRYNITQCFNIDRNQKPLAPEITHTVTQP